MHLQTPPDTTTTVAVSVCPRCGLIGKSGKRSCCGRGGSWFRHCGGGGHAKPLHAWHEGIQACKARLQRNMAMVHLQSGAQQKGAATANYEAVIAGPKTLALAPFDTSTPMPDATSVFTPSYAPDNVSTTVSSLTSTSTSLTPASMLPSTASASLSCRGCLNPLKAFVPISLFRLIIVC